MNAVVGQESNIMKLKNLLNILNYDVNYKIEVFDYPVVYINHNEIDEIMKLYDYDVLWINKEFTIYLTKNIKQVDRAILGHIFSEIAYKIKNAIYDEYLDIYSENVQMIDNFSFDPQIGDNHDYRIYLSEDKKRWCVSYYNAYELDMKDIYHHKGCPNLSKDEINIKI